MENPNIRTILLNAKEMDSWEYLHDHFTDVFGFPTTYERTSDDWMAYMALLDQRENRASYSLPSGMFTVIEIFNSEDLSEAHNEVLQSLIECACLVNFKRIELCLTPNIILSYNKKGSF